MLLPSTQPLAFLSYHRFNDEVDNGAIGNFRRDLSNEVRVQTGEEFTIFQDRTIEWGECWRSRIEEALQSSTFFIPIVTPGYFRSGPCTEEAQAFLAYERSLERKDLILPVIYVAPGPPDEEMGTYGHPLEKELFEHQFVNWTDLRFTDSKSLERKRRMADLALQIKSAIARTRSYLKNRDRNERFFLPKRLGLGRENEPFGTMTGHADNGVDEPRRMLRMAMDNKKQGNYEEAKRLHDELISRPIEWDKCIDLFVDQLYFSISLHDKLEKWQELDHLERYIFQPVLSKTRSIVSASAFVAMMTMYQASMALSMLRQTRLEEADKRIEQALEYPPGPDATRGPRILYANALVTRALIQHARFVYGEGAAGILTAARADLDEAQLIYRDHAKMGKTEEFHHLGRFYGTRAFLSVAENDTRHADLRSVSADLLEDARRAHEGANRTGYGRVAGLYCHAYCLSTLAATEENENLHAEYLGTAFRFLRDALAGLHRSASLGRYKLAALAEAVLQMMHEDSLATELAVIQKDKQLALERLQAGGFPRLEQLTRPEWLRTPLN